MSNYYQKQLQGPLKEWLKNPRPTSLTLQVMSGTDITNMMSVNLESIEYFRAMLDVAEKALLNEQEKIKAIPIIARVVQENDLFSYVSVVAVLNNGESEELFGYYPGEIYFTNEELIGLSVREARSLKTKKDLAYTQY